MNGQIFISYRRDDTSWVTTSIYQSLLKHFSKDQIFRDVDSIPYGVDFFQLIENEVSKCDAFIVVIGKDWLKLTDVTNTLENSTDFVRIEIATAFKRNVRVIPVIIDGARMPKPNELPDEMKPLSRINAVPVSNARFNTDISHLIEILQETFNTRRKEIKEQVVEYSKPVVPTNPWVILAIFTGFLLASFILGTTFAALIAGMLESVLNKKIELDSTLGWTMFWTCTMIIFGVMSFFYIKRRRNSTQ